ncbi:helix-turn-helix domain-containing protein [Streptomyces kebangsaanensis]|uniref:helix-turn-helix domain-containing protein n=1 Tax=Streptomyces kebangsaanensis TaxID=864058 RepID=UPI00389A5E7E
MDDSELGVRVTPYLISAQETAELLNMSVTWVYRDAVRCGLTPYKLGSGRNAKIQFKRSDVLKWLEQRRVA